MLAAEKLNSRIVNKQVFGDHQDLDSTKPEDGISHVKIDAPNIGNIPGVIEHWKKDLEIRKKHILFLKKRSLLQRVSEWIHQQVIDFPDATGEELYRLHPSKAAKTAFHALKRNPTDMMARLELVSIIGKSGRDFPIEVFRLLFLQATVATLLGELDLAGLKVVLWTQDTYFSKLFYKCKTEAESLKGKLDVGTGKNIYNLQSNLMYRRISDLHRNMYIIKHYQDHSKLAKRNTAAFVGTLSIEELSNYIVQENRDPEKTKALFQNAARIILLMRCMPLLHEETMQYVEKLRKIDPHEPLLNLLLAKIKMSKLVFAVGQYDGGDHRSQVVQNIRDEFNHTYHEYGIAVRKVGTAPKLAIDYTILMEYANLVHYFYRVAADMLGIVLPSDWLSMAFQKARSALNMIADEEKTFALQNDLLNDMVDAGLME